MHWEKIDRNGDIDACKVFFFETWSILPNFNNTFLVHFGSISCIQGIVIDNATLHKERSVFVVWNSADGIDKRHRKCAASVIAEYNFKQRVIL